MACHVLHVGKGLITRVDGEFVNAQGVAPNDVTFACTTPAPGQVCGAAFAASGILGGGAGPLYCRITVTGAGKNVRGTFCKITTGACSEVR
jgi:hypothetical protein